jgi:hypothetical protein
VQAAGSSAPATPRALLRPAAARAGGGRPPVRRRRQSFCLACSLGLLANPLQNFPAARAGISNGRETPAWGPSAVQPRWRLCPRRRRRHPGALARASAVPCLETRHCLHLATTEHPPHIPAPSARSVPVLSAEWWSAVARLPRRKPQPRKGRADRPVAGPPEPGTRLLLSPAWDCPAQAAAEQRPTQLVALREQAPKPLCSGHPLDRIARLASRSSAVRRLGAPALPPRRKGQSGSGRRSGLSRPPKSKQIQERVH